MKIGRSQKGAELETTVGTRDPSANGAGAPGDGASTTTSGTMTMANPYVIDRDVEEKVSDLLVQRGLVNESQVGQARIHQDQSGQRMGDVLVEMGVLGERDFYEVLGEVFAMPVVDLRRENPTAEALGILPEDVTRRFLVVPLRVDDASLVVAVADKPTEELRALVSWAAERPVDFVLSPETDVKWAIDSSYRAIGGMEHLVQAFVEVEGSRKREAETVSTEVVDDNAPVVQVVNRILTQAKRDRASDVHIEPSQDVVRVRFRVDGALEGGPAAPRRHGHRPGEPAQDHGGHEHRRASPPAGRAVVGGHRRGGHGRPRGDHGDHLGREVRVADPRQEPLGPPPQRTWHAVRHARDVLEVDPRPLRHGAVRRPHRKWEDHYALRHVGRGQRPVANVMTIEDPVEFIFPSINQIQTNEQAGLTFATGLKSILRQDPDVILVGEIRDVETARIAVQSALTGHFVLSSLHATDSVSALHRFLDMGIESFLIASSVLAIVGQRLVRRICPSCKARYTPTEEELSFYEESSGPPKTDFYQGAGCNFCGGTGYQDRIGVYELLQMTPEIKRLIVGWATQDELRRLATKQGMRTLREEAISLVAQDVTTISEVIRSIYAL